MTDSIDQEQNENSEGELDWQSEGGADAIMNGDRQTVQDLKPEATRWETLSSATMVGAMAALSAGNRLGDDRWRAAGVALAASRFAQVSLKEWVYKEYHPALVHALNSTGSAIWSTGFATNDRTLHTAGPAVSFLANLTSAGVEFYQGKADWWRRVIDAAESGMFAVTGITDNAGSRAGALAAAALGFLTDSAREPNLVGHALGFSAWAVGAGIRNDPLQSVGAGVVAGSEVFRLISPALNVCSERLSHVVAERNEQGSPLLPVRNPASPMGVRSQADSMNNPVASSVAAFAPPTLPSIESGPSFSSMIPESMTGSASRSALPLSGSTVAALGPVNSPSRKSSAASPTVAYQPPPDNATRAHTR